MVVGTLAIDGWTVTFGTARRGLGGLWPRPMPPLAVPNPSMGSVPTSYYLMCHYNYLCTLRVKAANDKKGSDVIGCKLTFREV